MAQEKKKLRAIFLGPPGAGKGTQVRASLNTDINALVISTVLQWLFS